MKGQKMIKLAVFVVGLMSFFPLKIFADVCCDANNGDGPIVVRGMSCEAWAKKCQPNVSRTSVSMDKCGSVTFEGCTQVAVPNNM